MRLEHVGIAVREAEAVSAILEKLFGARPYKSEDVESEAVRTHFFEADGTKIELLEATLDASPVARHIDRRGEGLHHLAFEVEDIQKAHQRLGSAGFRLLNEEPKRGADGKLIFFLHPKDTAGVLVELCQTAPRPLKPDFANAGDRRIAFYETGPRQAPPLLLLHSALGSAELELLELMRLLEPDFRIIAVDFTGHGRSEEPESWHVSLGHFSGDVIAVLDHLDLDRAHVFGFSMGGAVALRTAIDHPGRVDRVVVHATTPRFDGDEALAMAEALDPALIETSRPRRAAGLSDGHGPDRWKDLATRMSTFVRSLPGNPILDDDLATIENPVLVSHGDSDRYFAIERALHLWRTIPAASLTVHPGLDHALTASDLAPRLKHFCLSADRV